METFGAIALYALMMLTGLTLVSAFFVLLGIWFSDETSEDHGH